MNKFNSQICTSVEQSKRLLNLGLNPETADMEIEIFKGDNSISGYVSKGYWETEISEELVELIPAWSLHRLIELMDVYEVMLEWKFGIYECVISMLEERIKDGLIDKEYLKQ